MNVKELYDELSTRIPKSLSCSWDNDGLMCCPDPAAEVKRIMVALDITSEVAELAIRSGCNVIVSHHPHIFRPLKSLDPSNPVASKVIRLIRMGVAAMSFHTRLDAVLGGVNDILADAIGLQGVKPFGEDGEEIGRIGSLAYSMPLDQFATIVKRATEAPFVQAADAGRIVRRVAVVGGSGSDFVQAAADAGADTFLTGEVKHHDMTDAPELGINVVTAGHFFTENLICERLRTILLKIDPSLDIIVTNSNAVKVF